MAVRLRLMRMGKKKHPTYRVVATDARSPRDGRFIELIGRYDPHPHPSVVEIDNERAVHWLTVGAQPSAAVRKLLEISGAWGQFRVLRGDVHVVGEPVIPEEKQRKSKKVRQREAEEAEAAVESTEDDEGTTDSEAEPAAEAAEEPAVGATEEPTAEATEEPAAEIVEEPAAEAAEETAAEASGEEPAEEAASAKPEEEGA
ncbi:MAG: 30S ribosomal protein S16 [Acidimicrobiia bacterium]